MQGGQDGQGRGFVRHQAQRLIGNPITRSTILVASGTAVAQGLALLALPALTRLYSPETFGYFAIYASLLGLFVPVAALRFPMAIVLPRSDNDAWRIVVLSSLAIMATVSVMGLIVGGLWLMGARRLGWEPAMLVALAVAPIGVLLTAHYEVAVQWAVRFRAYKAMAIGKVSQAVAQIAAQLGAGLGGLGPLGLAGGDAIGRAAGVTGVWRATKHVRKGVHVGGMAEIRQQARRYRAFPLVSSWAALLNAAGGNLSPLLATLAFGPVTGGIFLVVTRIASVPTALIGSAAGDVVAGEAARRLRDDGENVHSLFKGALVVAGIFGVVVMAAAALVLTPTLPIILGPEWAEGGLIFLLLTPMAAAQLAVAPISRGLLLLERQGLQLAWDALRVVATAAPFILGGAGVLDPIETVAVFALGNVGLYVLHAMMILSAARAGGNMQHQRSGI